MFMEIEIDNGSGFCFGVTTAIKKAEEELARGNTLYCLGDIVHNGMECERLQKMGLVTINHDDLARLHNVKVLLRAHGEPPETYELARRNHIEIIDATCPVVLQLQRRIKQQYEASSESPAPQGETTGVGLAQIVIFGKRGHAEVIGLQGQTNNTAIVVEKPEEADALDFTRPIYLFSQTTKSLEDFHRLIDAIEARRLGFFEWHDTICRAVANRVEQLKQFAREQDVVLFVGGTKSSNAAVLFNHCKDANAHSYFLTSPEDLTQDLLNECQQANKVGICGATSTPLWLMEQVRDKLTKLT